ncbi:hypothetical protein [Aquimarina longa]|uniref:hypothetical protein n=1 Tax=Aquimarina longa TaxID=1080221 RepID=UPI0007852434|nr:hypothetical protein [Aquimarina longa]
MSNWLEEVRPPKYLRYFFYIAYSWYRPYKSERSEAHYTATIILSISNGLIALMLLSIIFTDTIYRKGNKHIWALSICFIFYIIFYYLFLYKKKWRKYIDEFSHLRKKDRRKGTIYLFLYLFIIFLILLPLSVYFIVKNSPHYT